MLNTLAPGLAFTLYALWSLAINFYSHREWAWVSSLTQGSYAFMSTLCLQLFVAFFYLQMSKILSQAKLITLLTSWLLVTFLPVSLHLWVGTPNVLGTVAPGVIVSIGYSTYLVMRQASSARLAQS